MKYKNRTKHYLVTLVFLLLWLPTVTNAQTTDSVRQNALGAMVVIQTEFGSRSGFYVAPDLIATNYHVIHLAQNIKARNFRTNEHIQVSGVVAIDSDQDLAILKVPRPNYFFLSLAPSGPGSKGYVVGNQDKGEGKGWIFKNEEINSNEFLIATWIAPNSSGGPVLNEDGEVTGILVRGVVSPHPKIKIPVGWAVDVTYLRHLMLRSEAGGMYDFPVPEYYLNSWVLISRTNMMLENFTIKVEEAIEFYNNALNSNSEFAAYLNRSIAKYKLRNFAMAVEDLGKATNTSTFKQIFRVTSVVSKGIQAAKAFIRIRY